MLILTNAVLATTAQRRRRLRSGLNWMERIEKTEIQDSFVVGIMLCALDTLPTSTLRFA